MSDEQRAAYIISQSACMLAELESMKAANIMCQDQGSTIAYGEDAFQSLPDKYGLGTNDVIRFFTS